MIDWRRPFSGRRSRAPVLLQPPEAKASAAGPLTAMSQTGRPVWTSRDYGALAAEGYGRNPVAYRCIRMIAEGAAATPLVVREGQARVGADHPLARLIERPNPEQSAPELLEAIYSALQTAGNAYVEAVGDEGVEELYALRPDRVSVIPGPSGWPAGYEYRVGGRSTRLTRGTDGFSPVLHVKMHHPTDDWYGQSPMEAAAAAIDVHNQSSAWNKALLDNGARPSGMLVVSRPGGLSAAQHGALRHELGAAFSGPSGAGRPLVLDAGIEWKPLSMSPADMDFIQGKHAAAREIALAFGVPPQLLGIPGDATYSNYREANAAFWRGTVIPLVRKTAAAMTVWLEDRFPGCRIEADVEGIPALAGGGA